MLLNNDDDDDNSRKKNFKKPIHIAIISIKQESDKKKSGQKKNLFIHKIKKRILEFVEFQTNSGISTNSLVWL